jgi:dehydrogenase/reductase SDR family member 12
MTAIATIVDAGLELSVVGGASRYGYDLRRRTANWDAEVGDLSGRTVLVTGGTSGIGLAAARRFAQAGASVRLLARHEAKAKDARALIERTVKGDVDVDIELADLADFGSLREFVPDFVDRHPRLDVLVNNGGMLSREYHRAPDGSELTLATHVLGPFLLTSLLLPALRAAAPARVITMSSGGMYAQRFDIEHLESGPEGYDGRVTYARAKRAQVVLTHEWAKRVSRREIVFHAMHPGWVDTPGLESGLPTFRRVMLPLLRSPDQGADTAVWLATDGQALATTGDFWHDRRRRLEHRLPWTLRADDGDALWRLCEERTGESSDT